MNEALAKWVAKLEKQPLPAIDTNLQLLRKLAGSLTSDMGMLAVVVESDPALSVLLLRHINQIRRKHLRSEITTPRHALMMLGLEQLKQLMPKITLASDLPKEIQPKLHHQYSQSFHAAYQAREWARLRRDQDVEEVYTAALLNNIGETQLNLHAPEEVERVNQMMQKKEMEPEEAQLVVFGFSYDQLTLELARAWNLPNLICDSVQPENASMSRVLNVMLAAQLARTARHGWYTRPMNKLIEEVGEFLSSDDASVATLIHKHGIEAARESVVFEVPHPAAKLIYPALSLEEPELKEKKSGNVEEDDLMIEADFCLMPQRVALVKALKDLNNPDETLPAKEVIRVVLAGMRDGLGLNRVVFASLTPNKDQLRASYMLGSDNDPSFKRFNVDLSGHNLFVRLMEKQQSLWLDENNRKKFFPIIPINFHKLIDNDSFFVMSLVVRGRPQGLFYADRRNKTCRLDEESYKRFKQLVTMASHHLGRS